MTFSDGTKVDNPRWYRNAQRRLRLKQRMLSRAKKGSKNRKKKVLAVQREHLHVQRQRKDFLDKTIHQLVNDYDLIAIEDLKITNMVKNKNLSKSILDAGWGYFKTKLLSKAVDAGKEVVLVNPAYTSKTCHSCGVIHHDMTLQDRQMLCDCGLRLDRDHNAAINILHRAYVQVGTP